MPNLAPQYKAHSESHQNVSRNKGLGICPNSDDMTTSDMIGWEKEGGDKNMTSKWRGKEF